jgi:hypothetical protein
MISVSDIVVREDAPCGGIIASQHYLYGPHGKKVRSHIDLMVDALKVIKDNKLIKYHPEIIFRIGAVGRKLQAFHYSGIIEYIELRFEPDRAIFLQCVCHELIHSEQHVLGKFKFSKNLMPIWKGKKYKPVNYLFPDKNSEKYYLNVPWEKEAYRRQDELACEVMGLLTK